MGNNILKLVIKDFRANTGYLLLLFAILISISVGFNLSIITEGKVESEVYLLVILISTTMATKLFIITETEVSADKLIAGLPVNRMQMVLARYLSSIMMIFLALMVHWSIVHLVSNEVVRSENGILYRPDMWIVMGLLLTLSDAFSFPFHFVFGAIKGGLMYGFALIAFIILTILTITLINNNDAWKALFLKITQQPTGLIFTELIALYLLILGSSMLISMNAYKNKDL
ncbi:MAG: ABC-2 transporter permease [Cytophagales bacterium]|nr:ABC-2 transporter permease [Cytophagales bacterium]